MCGLFIGRRVCQVYHVSLFAWHLCNVSHEKAKEVSPTWLHKKIDLDFDTIPWWCPCLCMTSRNSKLDMFLEHWSCVLQERLKWRDPAVQTTVGHTGLQIALLCFGDNISMWLFNISLSLSKEPALSPPKCFPNMDRRCCWGKYLFIFDEMFYLWAFTLWRVVCQCQHKPEAYSNL